MKNILKEGKVLYTKDGRLIGNAEIIKVYNKPDLNNITKDKLHYVIKTDYGNTVGLNFRELNDMFYFSKR